MVRSSTRTLDICSVHIFKKKKVDYRGISRSRFNLDTERDNHSPAIIFERAYEAILQRLFWIFGNTPIDIVK